MLWIVQTNLGDEPIFHEFLEEIKKHRHRLVKLVPFSNVIEPDVIVGNTPVFVYGSTSIGDIAKERGWTPGYFDDNLDMETVTEHYGELMLNRDVRFIPFKDVDPEWDSFFIRPCSDKKEFAGMVTSKDDFRDWQKKVIDLDGKGSFTSLRGDDRVMIAPQIEISEEYRLQIVDSEIVTGCRYKQHHHVKYEPILPEPVKEFVRKMIRIWQPNRAFVMDVGVTSGGYKVIEINSINSSGLYACDIRQFISAINNMVMK